MTRWALFAPLCLLACGDPVAVDEGRRDGVHPAAWPESHGAALRASGDDLDQCGACHALEGPDCTSCHEGGPTTCETCHRSGNADAPHAAHERFDCETCHAVPAGYRAVGHLEDRGGADVRFTGLALVGGHAPVFDANSGSCAQTACHAGPGAARSAPKWGPDPGATDDCGDCHGAPPPAHLAGACENCHVGVGAPGHVDGEVALRSWEQADCASCHSALSGTHARHLDPSAAAPVTCETCHLVPRAASDPGHLDDGEPGAEVVFSGRASGGEYTAQSCAVQACHGDSRPRWNGEAPCGSCHALPPAGHATGDCADCHVVAGAGPLEIGRADLHVDGAVDVDSLGPDDCGLCHGPGARRAPAGSHAAHERFGCTECHAVPTRPRAPGHLDGRVDLRLAGGGAFTAPTCAGTQCHGAGEPRWGEPASVAGCDACHGNPPPGHAAGECSSCHPEGRHVNGRLDVALPADCGTCHGLPPATGAHVAHANGGRDSAPVACATCHVIPQRADAPGHLDPPPAEVRTEVADRSDGGCADSRCHAGPGALVPAPRWDQGALAAGCGACHGNPPPDHSDEPCATCHATMDFDGNIASPERHADGRLDLR